MKTGTIISRTVIIAIIAILTAAIWKTRDRFTPLDVGSRAPDYSALSLDGDTVPLSSFAGDVVVLNIWATWCPPCVTEMPSLQRLHDQLADQGLSVVAVSVDVADAVTGSRPEDGPVRKFVDELGLTFTILRDPSAGIETRYQVNGLPTTYVIGRDGRIVRKLLGPAEWDRDPLLSEIRQLVEG